jgi:hypothetical protein
MDTFSDVTAREIAADIASWLQHHLDDHIRGCVLGTCRHGHEDQEEMVTELMSAIECFTRSTS